MSEILFCMEQGHQNNVVNYICLHQKCELQRLYCQQCYSQRSHTHNNQLETKQISNFKINLSLNKQNMTNQQHMLKIVHDQCSKILRQIIDSFNSIFNLIEDQQKQVNSHIEIIKKVELVVQRKYSDFILKSVQFKETQDYKYDDQFYVEIIKKIEKLEFLLAPLKENIEEQKFFNQQKKDRIFKEQILQYDLSFYNHNIVKTITRSTNSVKPSSPRGIYFFNQNEPAQFQIFKLQDTPDTVYSNKSVINIQFQYQKGVFYFGQYLITDYVGQNYVFFCDSNWNIDQFNLINGVAKHKLMKQSKDQQVISQLDICDHTKLVAVSDYKIYIFILTTLEQIYLFDQLTNFSGLIQFKANYFLIAVPINQSLQILTCKQQDQDNSIGVLIKDKPLFELAFQNVSAFSQDSTKIAIGSVNKELIQIFNINLRLKELQPINKLKLDSNILKLYWNFNDSAIIQITQDREYLLSILDIPNNLQVKRFNSYQKQIVSNTEQMFILGNEMDYLVEVYKEKIVIGKKILL